MKVERRLLQGDRQLLVYLALAVAGGLLAAAAVVGQAALLSHVLAGVFVQHRLLRDLGWPLAGVLLLALVRGGGLVAGELLGQRAATRAKAALRRRLGSRVSELGPLAMRGERSGEVATTMVEGVESLDGYLGQALPQLALAVLVPLLVLVVYLATDPLTALAVMVTAPFIPVLTLLIGLKTRDLMDRRWAQLARMGAHFLDMIQGLPTLKLFGQSQAQAAGIEEVSERYGRSTMDVLRVAFQSSLVLDLAATMGVALVAIEIGTRLLLRSIPFELAIFLLLLAPEFFLPLRLLALARHARLSGQAAARRIFAFLDSPAAPSPDRHPATAPTARQRPVEIRMESVAYTPPARDLPALRAVSLRLPPGRTTALVGPSGAGKTTLAALLLGFAAPQQGGILIDGIPLGDLDPAVWRRLVAWVPQLPHLFNGSVADNIRLGRPEASRPEVEQASADAQAHVFISGLPLGYDTSIGEGGARLSGGQRQRLALARAFLLDRPVVILDEPTLHLDSATAGRVRRAILSHCRGRTALLITHDAELAAGADAVVYMHEGMTLAAEAAQ
ncbi:thiol reductant ABC exporter subunit CydD [Candidatus Nephthysia bennettiae]|uniref:Thiol reductant ABC exporter subunit CydD n=1 Tax=Candidatus Nephthysia bennettiae TaxID=3127016 RepID=A0A934JX85_9BACT|nr:thiol reductant ABC exporter subunit CydD [Candidatus Dormibacteraeota bacterium]MBJ7612462.1 thiol reductant ABC exporter subunit CydD [Candidatus Dormibacteraeota bacterium]